MFASSYNGLFVLFSLLIAILASYTALDMAGRISSAQGRAVRWWLAGGACAMGTGIWSMHFIGMLAFSLPIPLGYDLAITVLSLLIAIASSAFALWLVARNELPWPRPVCGPVLMGAGVSAMHYTGMAAMRMAPGIRYVLCPCSFCPSPSRSSLQAQHRGLHTTCAAFHRGFGRCVRERPP
jgi:NO-binding membrane sensor protein with MHYT domain